MEARVI